MNLFVSVSGGLDSTALAILMSQNSKARFIFADTGDEFPQVHNHLDNMEKVLGIDIIRVQNKKYTLKEYEIQRKFFPSPKARYCTRIFKIKPIEEYLNDYAPFQLAIGLRYDETERTGNIADYAIYPLQDKKMDRDDVYQLCNDRGLIPEYPWYMSRGGCYSCFFKSKAELLALAKHEPELFNDLIYREETIQKLRGDNYLMFDRFKKHPLRRVKEMVDSKIENFEQIPMTYNTGQCGIFCRK